MKRQAREIVLKNKRDEKIISLEKSQNKTPLSHLDGLQNIDAKVGHQHRRETDALDKIYG